MSRVSPGVTLVGAQLLFDKHSTEHTFEYVVIHSDVRQGELKAGHGG